MYIFTIYDSISKKPGRLFTDVTIGSAERQFQDILAHSQDGSLFKSHPQDFALHLLGKFNEDTLAITEIQNTVIATGNPSSPPVGSA